MSLDGVPLFYAHVNGPDGRARNVLRSLAPARPHIVRDGALWVCRGGGTPAGYGYKPCQALREWHLMHLHTGRPAGAAQEAPLKPPGLVVHLGTIEDMRHV